MPLDLSLDLLTPIIAKERGTWALRHELTDLETGITYIVPTKLGVEYAKKLEAEAKKKATAKAKDSPRARSSATENDGNHLFCVVTVPDDSDGDEDSYGGDIFRGIDSDICSDNDGSKDEGQAKKSSAKQKGKQKAAEKLKVKARAAPQDLEPGVIDRLSKVMVSVPVKESGSNAGLLLNLGASNNDDFEQDGVAHTETAPQGQNLIADPPTDHVRHPHDQTVYAVKSKTFTGKTPHWSVASHAISKENGGGTVKATHRRTRTPIDSDEAHYLVVVGRVTGVFDNWDATEWCTTKFSGSLYKKYPTLEKANAALAFAKRFGWLRGPETSREEHAPIIYPYTWRYTLTDDDFVRENDPVMRDYFEGLEAFMLDEPRMYYCVYKGLQPGIFFTSFEDGINTNFCKGKSHEGFKDWETAHYEFKKAINDGSLKRLRHTYRGWVDKVV